jgi:hypothetical protein
MGADDHRTEAGVTAGYPSANVIVVGHGRIEPDRSPAREDDPTGGVDGWQLKAA